MDDAETARERIRDLVRYMRLSDWSTEPLAPYRQAFLAESDVLAEQLYHFLSGIPQTRLILQFISDKERLTSQWSAWFDNMFTDPLDESFLIHLWRAGMTRVDLNVDHRFVHLSYGLVRQICHGMTAMRVALEDRQPVIEALDAILDLYMLIETDSFVTSGAEWDRELIRGISHQVRNPVSVIGGNVNLLRRRLGESLDASPCLEAIFSEAGRLERMVREIEAYVSTASRPPSGGSCRLSAVVPPTLDKLQIRSDQPCVPVCLDIGEEADEVICDCTQMTQLLTRILENALEFADKDRPVVRLSATVSAPWTTFCRIAIYNNGTSIRMEDVSEAFTPFYSTKSFGTGFGLPIARMITEQCRGHIALSVPEEGGTLCTIHLPLAAAGHGARGGKGLFSCQDTRK